MGNGSSKSSLRSAGVAAEASGIAKPALLVTVFLFSGAVAAISGGLFASLQSYITPDAFTLDLSVLFFIAILIGGRGSILGPLLGTFTYNAGATACEFVATYCSRSDHGKFVLSRVK